MKQVLPVIVLLLLPLASLAETVVIVNPSVTDSFSKDDVKRLFLGKKSSFPGGAKATTFYLKNGNAAREHFSKSVLGKSSSQLKAYWSKLVFTGKGTPPEELANDAAAVAKVAADASAIAYVDAAAVTDGVKVVFTAP